MTTMTFEEYQKYSDACGELLQLVARVREDWPPPHSAHEAFAIIEEEFDELKTHVWTKQKNRDLQAMRLEALDVAATALTLAVHCCTEERGRR